MTIDNFTYTALPFYDSVAKQNFKKAWLYNDLCTAPLISSQNRLLPFQVIRPSRYNTVQTLELYTFEGNFVRDLLADIPANQLKITSAQGNDFITYFGTKDLTEELPCGPHYLVLYDGKQTWYSEVFSVDCFDWGIKRIATGNKKGTIAIASNSIAQQIITFSTQ